MKAAAFCRRGAAEDQCCTVSSNKHNRTNFEVYRGGDASQAGMGGKTEFSGVGLF